MTSETDTVDCSSLLVYLESNSEIKTVWTLSRFVKIGCGHEIFANWLIQVETFIQKVLFIQLGFGGGYLEPWLI